MNEAAVVASALWTLLKDQECRRRGGKCNCMFLCAFEADEIVQETAAVFREEVREIMAAEMRRVK